MPFEHGKDTVFKVDNSGGTLTDISAYCNNVDFSREIDAPETTTYGNDDRTYITGLRGSNFSVSGFYDATVDAVLNGIFGSGEVTFEYGPQGSTSGDVRYTGECVMTSYSPGSPVDGVSTWSADFLVTGAVTYNTYT